MKLKNYMKEGQKLPLFGIGSYLIYGIGLFSVICIIWFVYLFKIGNLSGNWGWVFRIAGEMLFGVLNDATWVWLPIFLGAVGVFAAPLLFKSVMGKIE